MRSLTSLTFTHERFFFFEVYIYEMFRVEHVKLGSDDAVEHRVYHKKEEKHTVCFREWRQVLHF